MFFTLNFLLFYNKQIKEIYIEKFEKRKVFMCQDENETNNEMIIVRLKKTRKMLLFEGK